MDKSLLQIKGEVENFFHSVCVAKSEKASDAHRNAFYEVVALLDKGIVRVADFLNGKWVTNEWVKKGILGYIYCAEPRILPDYPVLYQDHSDYKYQKNCDISTVRIVPPSHVRFGSYIGSNVVLMPSFINIGAYIDDGVMVDTFASIGSGAQIGKNVHISAGSGIGGVLEPIQANPTIIEDNCFIGARSEISEGVIVKQGAVVAGGVFISQSTKIYDRETGNITYGVVPENAVVVPGSLPSSDGTHSLAAAIIVKFADKSTRTKTKINDLLRE